MNHVKFRNEITLVEQAEDLGRLALKLGLIPSFVVRHFPDNWSFTFLMKTQMHSHPKRHTCT